VVGVPLYPIFMAKTGALFFFVFGVLALLGAAAQINPIWLYGPYHPDVVSAGSQPDWYIGFMEGALRLMPGVTTNLDGHTFSWNVFIPAVFLPFAFFFLMYLYPFFEQWVTGDRRYHNVLDRPRNAAGRTGFGIAVVTSGLVLLLAGGDDDIANHFDVPLGYVVWTLRVGFFLFPVLAFFLARYACLALQARDARRVTEGTLSGVIERRPDGGYAEPADPLPGGQRAAMEAVPPDSLIRPAPRHIIPLPTPGRIRGQALARLNHFYTRYQVETRSGEAQHGRYDVRIAQQEANGDGDGDGDGDDRAPGQEES